jgi:hypothetical protein
MFSCNTLQLILIFLHLIKSYTSEIPGHKDNDLGARLKPLVHPAGFPAPLHFTYPRKKVTNGIPNFEYVIRGLIVIRVENVNMLKEKQ